MEAHEAVEFVKEWVAAADPSLEVECDPSKWDQGELWVKVARPGDEPVRWYINREVLELAAAGEDEGTPYRPPLKKILADVVERAREGATGPRATRRGKRSGKR